MAAAAAMRIHLFVLFSLFFSHVHSKDYKIVQNGEIEKLSGSCNLKGIKFAEHNDSWLGISGQMQLGQEIKEGVKIDIIGYEKRGNSYQKHALLQIKNRNACSYLKDDKFQRVANNNNLPKGCPIPANTYNIAQSWIEISKLPNTIPGGEHWAAELILKSNGKEFCKNRIYVIFQKRQKRNQNQKRNQG